MYSGYGPDGSGHAFVLDGYTDDGYFGVNWGWGGLADGYFLIDAMEPSEAGAGGGAGSFSLNQIAVLGLKPDEGGNYVESLGFMKYSDAAGDFNGLSIRYGTIAQDVTGDVLEIDTAGLEAGTYTLVLSRQDDVKEISLTF